MQEYHTVEGAFPLQPIAYKKKLTKYLSRKKNSTLYPKKKVLRTCCIYIKKIKY